MKIAEENEKILRQALTVLVGMDVPFANVTNVTAAGNYPGSSGAAAHGIQKPILMDLANGGFYNDGLAIPLSSSVDGFISQIGEPLNLRVQLAEETDEKLSIIGLYGGDLHKWTFNGTGNPRTITIPADTKRIIINRVVCGEAFWYDNASLISCNLQLRAVETKADNPELQMSEIEIAGYEPEDITEAIGQIGTGYPIYYTSGYPGDMAPTRMFYLGEPIEWEGNQATIKGYDATMYLDEEFGGTYIGNPSTQDGAGANAYFNRIAQMVTNAGIDLEYTNSNEDVHLTNGTPVFIPKVSKRSVIAQAVNLFRWPGNNPGWDGDVPIYINYVDAGRPRMWTGKDEDKIKTISLTTKPKVIIDPVINTIKMNIWNPWVDPSATIETQTVEGTKVVETSDPYYSFTTSSGTITRLGPYAYRITANGSPTISGRKIQYYDDSPNGTWSPLTVSQGEHGIEIELEDFYGTDMYRNAGGSLAGPWLHQLQALLDRSNISYEFEYRGDPKLQPRDYIRVDIDGSGTLTEMTIDTIELKHEGGGTTSTITARKGII